jgi:hypothetical protein
MVLQHKTHGSSTDPGTGLLPVALTDPPVPLVRIFTCGGLRIEVLQQPCTSPEQARYEVATGENFNGRGLSSAHTLLKMLVSASRRCLTKDWIQENWAVTEEDRIPFKRVENAAWYLRGLLCPPYVSGKPCERCRRALVHYKLGSPGSGGRYALGTYLLIWIDVDALDWNVRQACRMERYGDDALPFWERAYHLASQGVYLPDDLYSDWAEPRRTAVMGALRQSVHAFRRGYLAHYGERGQAELLRVLEDYLVHFPTDEDVLRSLMELLGQYERFQEVEYWAVRTQQVLEEGGSAWMRGRWICGNICTPNSFNVLARVTLSLAALLLPEGQSRILPLAPHLSEAIAAGVIRALEVLEQNTRGAAIDQAIP